MIHMFRISVIHNISGPYIKWRYCHYYGGHIGLTDGIKLKIPNVGLLWWQCS